MGRRADLLLAEANPLEDVKNASKLAGEWSSVVGSPYRTSEPAARLEKRLSTLNTFMATTHCDLGLSVDCCQPEVTGDIQ
jgi:hypothetical protein